MAGMSGAGIDGVVTGGLAAAEFARRAVEARRGGQGKADDGKAAGGKKGQPGKNS